MNWDEEVDIYRSEEDQFMDPPRLVSLPMIIALPTLHSVEYIVSSSVPVDMPIFLEYKMDVCTHGSHSKCDHCEKPLWILDSCAFMHFTPHKSDFMEYHDFGKSKIPVQTAAGQIFVIKRGKCAMLWKDKHNKLHTLLLYNIGHIPNSGV